MTLRNDLTAATTPFGMWARPSTYMGTSCGMEVSKTAQLEVLGHLYRHRAGAKRQKQQKGSRVARARARTVLSRLIAAVRASATATSTNATLPIATRIEHQLPQNLVSKDPKLDYRLGLQTCDLSSIVAVDHWIFRFIS